MCFNVSKVKAIKRTFQGSPLCLFIRGNTILFDSPTAGKAMSQPAKATQKNIRLSIRVTTQEKATLAEAARVRQITVSQFVLKASLTAAHTILIDQTESVDQTEFRLSPDQWEAFCQRLDEPPKAIPALQKLFSEQELF
jgi:uncharacterized protein (DUF1778 family)